MNVKQLRELLEANRESQLNFMLPSGEQVPPHFHVTEVGRVHKSFIDCGGVRRDTTSCLIQLWTATDLDHRLTAGKWLQILTLAEPVLQSDELPVEFEYGNDVAAQYSLLEVGVSPTGLTIELAGKQTDCLARDRCGLQVVGADACSGTGCC